jgi:hypothetical protein
LVLLHCILALAIVSIGACSSDKSSKTAATSFQLFAKPVTLGWYDVCWSQRNQAGAFVADGLYRVHMQAAGFDTVASFRIVASTSHVQAPDCCDTLTVTPHKIVKAPPDHFGMILNSQTYARGDSIAIEFAIPVACSCTVEIIPTVQ